MQGALVMNCDQGISWQYLVVLLMIFTPSVTNGPVTPSNIFCYVEERTD